MDGNAVFLQDKQKIWEISTRQSEDLLLEGEERQK